MGGILRGVYSSEANSIAHFGAVKAAIDEEKRTTNDMILLVDVENGLQTQDTGAGNPFSHKIYHFEVDPKYFRTKKVIFASEWVKSSLDALRLEKLHLKYLEAKK